MFPHIPLNGLESRFPYISFVVHCLPEYSLCILGILDQEIRKSLPDALPGRVKTDL